MAQRSSPILPITSGIGAVSPVNVGGPGSAEEAFRNQQGVLQRLLSGIGSGNNVSLEDLARSQFRDRQDLATGLESAGSSRFSPGQSVDITGQSNQILPPGFSSTDLTPIPGSIGMSEVPVTGAPDLTPSFITTDDPAGFSILTPRGQSSLDEFLAMLGPGVTPRERKEREAFRRSEDAMGGTLFGDAVDVTPAQAQETAGLLPKLIQDSATRGGAETAATEGEGSGTTVQGDVTDITDQPDDLVEQKADSAGDVEGINLGTGTDESAAETAFKSGYDAYLEALGESKDIGSIEDYKKEFADATGIDISGKVDNSAALMAFGLALMQNKAGKGFNVGNILSSVGAAGEAAQPLMIQARKEARAGQLAGGKYALEQRKAAKANRQALLEAERDRINELLKQKQDFENQKALKRLQGRIDAGLERLKAENSAAEAEAKGVDTHLEKTESFLLFDDAPDVFKVNAFIENPNLPDGLEAKLKLTKASVARLGPQFEASERALARAEQELVGLTNIIANEDISTQAQIGSAIASLGRGFGINTDSELSPVAQAKIILRRIATEEAPAILGEAGKTISDADRERVTDIVGDIGLLEKADPKVILNKLGNVYKTIVEKGRSNLDTAYNVLHESGYDYGPYAQQQQQQQSTGMEIGETRDMGGVSVKRTG